MLTDEIESSKGRFRLNSIKKGENLSHLISKNSSFRSQSARDVEFMANVKSKLQSREK